MASVLTLRKVLEEPVLLGGFSEFCKVQHAYENLEFWLAVELFKETFGSGYASPREASTMQGPTSSTSPLNRKSTRRTFWTALTSNSLQRIGSKEKIEAGGEAVKDIALQANQIYSTFLMQNAEKWVCVDQSEQEEVKRLLDAGGFDYKLFDVVQKQVFVNMEKDLLPRFSKAFEAPEEKSVFQTSARVGSVRFVPDPKLRASVVRSTGGA